ncbi:MAG: hypothetical protein HY580_03380 [Nitrospinae bacterium]|nr:hypothetical protein [Nitrospinota bacterium]
MKILINGIEDAQKYDGTTLGDVLRQIEQTKVLRGTFISNLKLNRQDSDLRSEEVLRTPIPAIQSLEIEISSISALITKNIANAEEYLNKLIPGIQKAAGLFHSGSEQEANQFFIIIVDGIDWLSQVVDSVVDAMGMDAGKIQVNGKTVLERKSQLLDLIQQMLNANKNKDWVHLADLLEYEILPFYQEWQTFLPQLRQAGLEKIN